MFQSNESSPHLIPPTTVKPAYSMPSIATQHRFASLYQFTTDCASLRMKITDGQVALELKHDGDWHRMGALDVIEFIPRVSKSDSVTMHIADIVDHNGQAIYTAWGRTESGCSTAEWLREDDRLVCKLKMPPIASQVSWLKFTIGAQPTRAGTQEPAPFDPMAIIRKEG